MDEFELHRIVYDDALSAWTELVAEDNSIRRRSYVRTAFAAMEALTFQLKRFALRYADKNAGLFTAGELAMLREEAYSIGKKGKVLSSAKFASLPDNFHFAMNMAMKGVLPGINIHIDAQGWDALRSATAIRNRLVHPKAAAEMIVSDQDLQCVQDAFSWVNDYTVQGLVQALEFLQKRAGTADSPELTAFREQWRSMRERRSRSV